MAITPPTITWTDTIGTATLKSFPPRFGNWVPDWDGVGEQEASIATGAVEMWLFREDYVATFEINQISAGELSLCQRLKRHLMTGGQCTVSPADLYAQTFTMALRPKTIPKIQMEDREQLMYTMALELINVGVTGGEQNGGSLDTTISTQPIYEQDGRP